MFSGARHGRGQPLEVHGLFQQVGGSALHGGHRGAHIRVAGEHDDGEVGVVCAKRLQGSYAIGVREPEIKQHDIGRVLRGHPAPLGGGGGPTCREPEGLEKFHQR